MKINELHERLERYIANGKGHLSISVASDAEGNGFRLLDEVTVELCTQEGEAVHPDDIEEYYAEEVLKQQLVIWPS